MTYDASAVLVSMQDCKEYLQVDPSDTDTESLIGYLMQSVSRLFKETTGRSLIQEEITEYHDGDGTDCVMLRSAPVSSTAANIAVYLDNSRDFDSDSQISGSSLFVSPDTGEVHYNGGYFDRGQNNIKVVYTAGYTQANIPHDLRIAALEALGAIWKRRQEKRFDVTSSSRGDVNTTYLDDMPHIVRTTLQRYRTYA